MQHDLIIKKGNIIDGTGSDSFFSVLLHDIKVKIAESSISFFIIYLLLIV